MNTSEHGRTIRVNRAPVLTLWATVVAEQLGFDRDAALTCGDAGDTARQRRKVKSGPVGAPTAADRHERYKDYLSPSEVAKLLDAAKSGRTACAITFCC